MKLTDSHAHLETIDDLKAALERAKASGVSKIVTIGTSLESSKKAIEIAQKYSSADLQIWATCGLHPKDASKELENFGLIHCFKTLKQIAQSSNKVVAIGECGLDYYVTGNSKQVTSNPEKKTQRELFKAQVELAADFNLPLIIHCRNAWDEIFDLISKLQTTNSKLTGVFHSWTGDWQAAQKALDLGFYISFSGIVTFKNAPLVSEVAKKIPLERMLIETDSPHLSPEPMRSSINEPQNVKIVGQFIAGLRGLSFVKIAEVPTKNAQELFRI